MLDFCRLYLDLSLPWAGTLGSGGGGRLHRPVPRFCGRAPCPACDLAFPVCNPSFLGRGNPVSQIGVWEEVVGSTYQRLSWSRHPPQQGPKGSAQGAQEPGHLPETVGQVVQVSGQTNQLHLQPSRVEEVVHESHQPATSVPFPDDSEDEAARPGKQNRCGCRDHNRRCACPGGAQTEGVRAACEQPRPEPHPQSWRQDPHLRPVGPGLPQGLWHRLALWATQGPGGVQAFWQGPRNPAQPHQTLREIQGPEIRARQRSQGQPWLQKLTPDPALLLKILNADGLLCVSGGRGPGARRPETRDQRPEGIGSLGPVPE